MGIRYYVSVRCQGCDDQVEDVYYAPTCGFTSFECSKCGHVTDLEQYTGISREDASNASEISALVEGAKELPGSNGWPLQQRGRAGGEW